MEKPIYDGNGFSNDFRGTFNMDATVFPSAVIMDIFVPCLIPWASAKSILGPGIMEAIKTVII